MSYVGLVELLFSLPMSNGHLERVFSQLKHIKTNRRTGLSENRLDSLLRIVTTGPPLSEWDASGAVQLWWTEKKRRNVSDVRSQPSTSSASTSTSTRVLARTELKEGGFMAKHARRPPLRPRGFLFSRACANHTQYIFDLGFRERVSTLACR